jgi:hypothetical protein
VQEGNLTKLFKTRENLFRLGLALFGITFIPGIVFLVRKILFESPPTLNAFYSKFNGSLLNLGLYGLYSWTIVCAFMIYVY